MGHAVARTLSGTNNPSARLTVSFPRVTGQCPVYYNHPNTGRPSGRSKFTSKYMDIKPGALYEFGHGLSYSRFAFENVQLKEITDSIQVTLDVVNTSDRDGEEVVQLYLTDKVASLVRPVKELKGFEKVAVDARGKVTVNLNLAKKDLGFWNNQGRYCLEDGDFTFTITDGNDNNISFKLYISF